jgi:Putative peptidoglycan binding domain
MPSYTIQAGDTLMALAVKNGLKSYEDILNHASNAELKKKSDDPGVVNTGDVVFIPNRELKQHPSAIDAVHPFKITRPKAWLRLAVKDAYGAPYAGKKYDLNVEGTKASGTLPDNGVIELAVPVASTSGTLRVWAEDGAEPVTWELKLGYINPITEISGVQQRLNNLAFRCGEPDGVVDDELTAAVKAFQARIGVDPTGTIDDDFRAKLKSYYDNASDERTQDKNDDASG